MDAGLTGYCLRYQERRTGLVVHRNSYTTPLPRTDLVVHRNEMVVNTRKIFRCWGLTKSYSVYLKDGSCLAMGGKPSRNSRSANVTVDYIHRHIQNTCLYMKLNKKGIKTPIF